MGHLFLFYVFATLISGLLALSAAAVAYYKRRLPMLRYFLYFYAAFTWLVIARLLVSYADHYLMDGYPKFFLLFNYFESFVGKFLIMATFPIFVHNLTKVPRESFRNGIIIAITVITVLAQHLTEYILGDPQLDQWGDYFEDAVFFAVMLYAYGVALSRHKLLQESLPRKVNRMQLYLSIFFIPAMINDVFFAEQNGIRFYPFFYALFGVCLAPTWLALMPSSSHPSTLKAHEDLGLSKREAEITTWVLQGKSNQEIAEGLFISLSTVKTHLRNIFRKLQVKSRFELMRRFENMPPPSAKPNDNEGSNPLG